VLHLIKNLGFAESKMFAAIQHLNDGTTVSKEEFDTWMDNPWKVPNNRVQSHVFWKLAFLIEAEMKKIKG
jgi:hypothetical protein